MASVTVDQLQVLITANAKDLDQKLKQVTGQLDDTGKNAGAAGKAFEKFGQAAKVAALAAGAAMAAGIVMAVKATANLEQSLGGSEVVFGKYAKDIQATARTSFSQMGTSVNQFLETANKMGSLFQGAGYSVKDSMKMTQNAMQRATDVATAMGIDTSTALESIAGAAKGNFTMMDNLGVAMNDTTLNAYALEKGIGKTTQQMTNAEKVGLAMQMFMDRTAKYAGNYAKENETLAGSFQTLKGSYTNFLSGVDGSGKDLAKSLVQMGKVLAKKMPEIAASLGKNLQQLASDIFNNVDWGALNPLKGIINYLAPAFRSLYNSIANEFIPAVQNAALVLAPFAQALGTALVVAVGLAVSVFTGLISALSAVLSNTQLLQTVLIPLTVAFIAYKGAIVAVNAVQLLQAAYAAATGTSYLMLNGSLIAVRTATIAQTVAQEALNLAMKLNPIGLVVGALTLLGAAFFATTQSTDRSKSATDRLNDARKQAKVTADALRDAENGLRGANLGVEGATIAVARAQENLTRLKNSGTATSLDLQEAEYQLKRAQDDLKGANDRVAEATKNKTKAEQDNINAAKEVQAVEAIKKVVLDNTTLSANNQTDAVERLKEKLNKTDGTKADYKVEGNTSGNISAVDQLRNRLSALNGTSVSYSIKGIESKSGSGSGYSSGGFTGRGGKYEMAGIVHKGEYVMPKELVNQSTGLPKSFSNSNASSDFGDNSQPLIINVGGERLVDTVIQGINGRSFLGGSSVINV